MSSRSETIRAVDLFAGAGGLSWGLVEALTSSPVVTNATVYLRNGSIINAISRSEPALQWEMSDIGGGRDGPSVVDGWLFAESPPATPPSLLAYTALTESSPT